ncbi:uncharacterized protein [Littorina saxatilis]|uniref:Uncharacterized protein n=1 Tax=Littorina saxatilis TaxID=31220 RepID=A0AAN9FWA8_9CAEN
MASWVLLALSVTGVLASDFKADLRTGDSQINGAGISWKSSLTTPTKNLGTCGCHMQGVVKLTFNTSNRTKAEIIFSFDNSKGWTFNVGDSSSNNGYAGDASTQSNDAEVHSINKDFFFYGRDNPAGGSYGLLYRRNGFLRRGDVKVTVEDGLVTAESGSKFIYFHSNKMFQLMGQSDKEGQVNYDVYIGLNRVVSATYRSGTGLCDVEVNWV